MSTTTANYGFVKPSGSDRISIAVINSDLDAIDTALASVSATLDATNATLTTVETTATTTRAGVVFANDPTYGTAGTRAAFINALDAADALGRGTTVYIPSGLTVDVGNGLSMSGRSCLIQGAGAGYSGTPRGSVIYASTQTGPVLDFTGWLVPSSMLGKLRIGGFAIRGSGAADATKANSGIKLASMSSTTFSDIAISGTGGPGMDLQPATSGDATYCCDFERILFHTPVGAKANDVPYFRAVEPNGNRFRGLGFRSTTANTDCGASGAIRILQGTSYTGENNLFDGCWFEYLHAPSGGSLINCAVNTTIFRDFQFFDCSKESGATNTAVMRFTAPTAGNYGGNQVLGVIPGSQGGLSFDTGVDLYQSKNSVEGIKGYAGNNVTLRSGIDYTFVHLKGSESVSGTSGWTNSSGGIKNHLIDELQCVETRPASWVIS